MNRLSPLLLLLALFAAGCDDFDADGPDGFDVDTYVGSYRGTVTTRFERDGSPTSTTAPVMVTLRRTNAGDDLLLTVDPGPPDIGGADPDPLTFPGTSDDEGARFEATGDDDSLVFTVDADGDIAGGGTLYAFDLLLGLDPVGRITANDLDLLIDVEVERGSADVPTGTDGLITLDAERVSR